jgi:predicted nucleotidyltransferase
MTSKDYEIARKLKERLSIEMEILDFRIFGSRARDGDEFSDMDVFLEISTINKEIKEKILDIAWEVGFENFMVISPLIFTTEEMENSPLRSSPIIKNIMEEGIKI